MTAVTKIADTFDNEDFYGMTVEFDGKQYDVVVCKGSDGTDEVLFDGLSEVNAALRDVVSEKQGMSARTLARKLLALGCCN